MASCFLKFSLLLCQVRFFFVEALFDTGFTDGWLAINTQDLSALEWSLLAAQVETRGREVMHFLTFMRVKSL